MNRLNEFHERMVNMSTVLTDWLDEHYGYTGASIFFLCGVLRALISSGWPDDDDRPEMFTQLLVALDRAGAELGPEVTMLEMSKTVPVEPQTKRKPTIN